MTLRKWAYLVGLVGSLTSLSLASGSCGQDGAQDGAAHGGGGSSASSSGDQIDCGCSCEENPDDVFFCSCPDQLDMDCCADADEPSCSGGLAAVCVGPYEAQKGWYCPCDGLAVPTCPAELPLSCMAGTLAHDPSDDAWACGGCVAATLPSCPASAPLSCEPGIEWDLDDDVWTCSGCDPQGVPQCPCAVCVGGSTWTCADLGPDCPGSGGGGTGGGGGMGTGGAGGA